MSAPSGGPGAVRPPWLIDRDLDAVAAHLDPWILAAEPHDNAATTTIPLLGTPEWVASESGELCTCDVTLPLGLSQPTVSHHFKKLTEAGLVIGERRGTWTYYRVVPEALAALAAGISPATTVASC